MWVRSHTGVADRHPSLLPAPDHRPGHRDDGIEPTVLLAIDGGNSKTDAVLLDDRGVFLERLQGPGSGGGPEHLASVVGRMLTASAAAHEAGGAGAVTACAAAVAGLDFDEDADLFRAALSRLLPAARVEAGNDAV